MNFEIDVNKLIPYNVTKYNSDLAIIHPPNLSQDTWAFQLNRDMKRQLGHIIDKLGEASRNAQGLKEVITSYRRLSMNTSHRIYLVKNATANNGKGMVVGMLKVGEKRLFVYDQHGVNHELQPLCVLDFYVSEREQRKGYGKMLFDYMLAAEQVQPEHLAIDAPSDKCFRFLRKHYALKNAIQQNNSFVVFDGFFDNAKLTQSRRRYDTASANPYRRAEQQQQHQPSVPSQQQQQQQLSPVRAAPFAQQISRNNSFENSFSSFGSENQLYGSRAGSSKSSSFGGSSGSVVTATDAQKRAEELFSKLIIGGHHLQQQQPQNQQQTAPSSTAANKTIATPYQQQQYQQQQPIVSSASATAPNYYLNKQFRGSSAAPYDPFPSLTLLRAPVSSASDKYRKTQLWW